MRMICACHTVGPQLKLKFLLQGKGSCSPPPNYLASFSSQHSGFRAAGSMGGPELTPSHT